MWCGFQRISAFAHSRCCAHAATQASDGLQYHPIPPNTTPIPPQTNGQYPSERRPTRAAQNRGLQPMDAHAAQCRPIFASHDRGVQPRDADAAQCHPRSANATQNPSNAFENFRGFCIACTCPPLSARLRGCVGGWACHICF